ncbi:MAG TPA: hypothetical protein VLG47_07250 [Candidatus Saccharimonadales bacterium]|nr:hypothetical protein [Candidatus Saccharimonadales bacterium]
MGIEGRAIDAEMIPEIALARLWAESGHDLSAIMGANSADIADIHLGVDDVVESLRYAPYAFYASPDERG